MKKLEMAKQKGKEIAQKGKEIWDKNKVFIGVVGGAVLYAVAEDIANRIKKPDKEIRNVYFIGKDDEGHIMREHVTSTYRFGSNKERDIYSTRENVEKMIELYQKALDLDDAENNQETED